MYVKPVALFVTLILVFAILMYIAGPLLICAGVFIGYFWDDIYTQIKKVGKYVARKD